MINNVTYHQSNEISDNRGSFLKIFSKNWDGANSIELEESFVTRSLKGSTRGMHIQVEPTTNWKIISIIEGHIFDVLVDTRKNSETYLKINEKYIRSGTSIVLPPGVAHGFQALETSILLYLSSKSREIQFDLGFNVQSLPINWPMSFEIQSERDQNLPHINDFLNRH